MALQNTIFPEKQALALRLSVGLIFGLLIATLIETGKPQADGLDTEMWRASLTSALALSAFVIWAGAAAMRRFTLAIWSILAFGLIYYISDRAFGADRTQDFGFWSSLFLLYPLLFIAHELVSSGDQSGKLIAPYETYFDEAWKRGVQLVLAIVFVLLFWGILWLGAALLGFIGFDWLEELLKEAYFHWPASGLAFGAAVHLGDIQTKLLSNVRNLVLGVMSWLLPIITLIGAIFAVSLLRSGLQPLWSTKAATASLLAACVGFVLLINAAYQQGDNERPVSVILKWCVRLAAILLLVFSVLAAWSLWLRIAQYGLSGDRVLAGVGVIIALAFGVGYSVAVFWPGRWMERVEQVNIGLAFLKVVIFLAILTPIAAPARLSVADQVARLNSGKVTVADFDWWLLKDDTGQYGKRALEVLAKSNEPEIVAKAQAALDDKIGERPYRDVNNSEIAALPPRQVSKLKVVSPKGAALPETFLAQARWPNDMPMPEYCYKPTTGGDNAGSCSAAMLDLDGDQQDEIILRSSFELRVYRWTGTQWEMMNVLNADKSINIEDFDAGLIRGETQNWKDIAVGPVGKPAAIIRVRPIVMDPTPVPELSATPAPSSK